MTVTHNHGTDYSLHRVVCCLFFGFNRNVAITSCSIGTLTTNVMPHRNVMPHTQDMTPHLVTVYRHRADLSLCYPLMWNVTLEYTATHFNVLGQTLTGKSFLGFFLDLPQTLVNAQLYDAVMVVNQSEAWYEVYRTHWTLTPGPVACESITLSACP